MGFLLTVALALNGALADMAPIVVTGVVEKPPPEKNNIHLVEIKDARRFWRGAAPTKETVEFLAKDARARGVTVTLVDLRRDPTDDDPSRRRGPNYEDDRSGARGRLSPENEKKSAEKEGIKYLLIGAMDRQLLQQLRAALSQGDVYMHCMYGVNRTGYATGRYAYAEDLKVSREGFREDGRDFNEGVAFQKKLAPRR